MKYATRPSVAAKRWAEWTPSIIYLLVLGAIVGASLLYQHNSNEDDQRRTVAFERIAAALEKCGER